MSVLALISLGSNLGDRRAILDGAVAALSQTPEVKIKAVSSFHETKPVGGPPGQTAFLNAAAALETSLEPMELLHALQGVEADFGRLRTVRWGERTLDLDLILFGEEVLDRPDLILPHPSFNHRRFVLAPAVEVAPAAMDPLTECTIFQLLSLMDRRPSLVCLDRLNTARPPLEPGIISVVQARLAERLRAIPLHRQELARSRCQSSHPWKAHYTQIRAIAHRMSARNLMKESSGDRWLVTAFVLEQAMRRGHGHAITDAQRNQGLYTGPPDLTRYVKAASTAVSRALAPTLIVLIPRKTDSRSLDLEFSSPVLIPQSEDPEEIVAEILVACEATRS